MISQPEFSNVSDLTRGTVCNHLTRAVVIAVSASSIFFTSIPASGAPLSLAQSPLFTSTTTPANVFILADDSGSMDWNMVTLETDGVMHLSGVAASGVAQSGSNSGTGSPSIVLANTASSNNNSYNGMTITITSGTGAGQVRTITGYSGGARRATVDNGWTTVPNATSQYRIDANNINYTYVFPQADNNYSPPNNANGRILPSEQSVQSQAANMPSDAHGVWRGRYHGYNRIYYNPEINYQPWPGVDDNDDPLPNAKATSGAISVTALRLDPYLSSSATVDITSSMSWTAYRVPGTTNIVDLAVTGYYPAQYYTWTDSNSNGVVDAADGHTYVEIRGSGDSCSSTDCPTTFSRPAARSDCAQVNPDDTRACTRDEELKNFANWFMYFRRRELTAKNAIGNVINPRGSELRMGHATLHNNSGSSNIEIASMNTSNTTGNKKALLNAVYGTQSDNGTPLRTRLDETGKYFECANGTIFGDTADYSCPWLSQSNGGACQKSFVVMTTDGYYNDSFSGLGNTDADGDSPNANGNTPYDAGAYADTYSNTLADVAMHYYERDLRTTLPNNVPVVTGIDDANHQHIATYTVAFGVSGTLSAGPSDSTAAFTWPNPTLGDLQKIDDLRHAAYNGRGKFVSAGDPTALQAGIQGAFQSIINTIGSASAVAVNTRTLTTGTTLYQARFDASDWSGDLRAVSIDPTTGTIGSEIWSAKQWLSSIANQISRVFLTYKQAGDLGGCTGTAATPIGTTFSWGDLSPVQQCLLNDNPETVSLDGDSRGNQRVDYLRGSTTNEGTTAGMFRPRGGYRLGDIINSTPVYVGAPTSLPDSLETMPHSTFANGLASRPAMLYVGGNDGMLHGFDAATGSEKIAYLPSQIYPNLSKLTDPSYSGNHLYYVDGPITAGDAFGNFPNGCASFACWRTVLVGTLGGGGKGIFALDVSDPTGLGVPGPSSTTISGLSFSEANATNIVMWEFIEANSATPNNDMGYVYGEVTIAKMHNNRWAAIFGNGYNSVNENAVIYIVDIVDGSLIQKIVLNPYATPTGNSNGMSAPIVFDRDNDFIADYIYAGDLRGNLWKIDVTSNNPNDWDSPFRNGSTKLPLFQAVDSAAMPQAVTAKPMVRVHPGGQPGYMVYVGTGRYIASGDKIPVSSPINAMFGIWDRNTNTSAAPSSVTPVARSNLLVQTISMATVAFDLNNDGAANDAVRTVSSNPINWSTHQGWVLNLRTNQTDSLGEMSVTNPVLATAAPERLIFTTLIPSQDPCLGGGTGWLMEVRPDTGGNVGQAVFDLDGDGVISAADLANGIAVSGVNLGLGIMPEVVLVNKPGSTPIDLKLVTGSTGGLAAPKNYLNPPLPPTGATGGRRSWRQLQ
jgi:type IV pilus assembly protein PilY1